MESCLDNRYIYLHCDYEIIKIKGNYWDKKSHDEWIPELVKGISGLLHLREEPKLEDISYNKYGEQKEYGYNKLYIIRYKYGVIKIFYDREFKEGSFIKYPHHCIMAKITLSWARKMNYSGHHNTILLLEAILDNHWTTKRHYISRAEISADCYQEETALELFKTAVPTRARVFLGYLCRREKLPDGTYKRYKQQIWLENNLGQYIWVGNKDDEKKRRSSRRKEYHIHIHRYKNKQKGIDIEIYRIEVVLFRKYLRNMHIDICTHKQLIHNLKELFITNIKFKEVNIKKFQKFYFKNVNSKKYKDEEQEKAYRKLYSRGYTYYFNRANKSTVAFCDAVKYSLGSDYAKFLDELEYPRFILDANEIPHRVL